MRPATGLTGDPCRTNLEGEAGLRGRSLRLELRGEVTGEISTAPELSRATLAKGGTFSVSLYPSTEYPPRFSTPGRLRASGGG